jgi:hypothetical protein
MRNVSAQDGGQNDKHRQVILRTMSKRNTLYVSRIEVAIVAENPDAVETKIERGR